MTYQTAPRRDWLNPDAMDLVRSNVPERDRRAEVSSDFQEKWGLEPGEAKVLSGNPFFKKMLGHLEQTWMTYLRADDKHDDMLRDQGAARLLEQMLGIESELEEIEKVEDE